MQAGAYQNGTWVVGVANTGNEEGVPRDAQSQIIAPSGETMSMTVTDGDELIVARCDLDLLQFLQEHDVQLRARSDRSDQAQTLTAPTGSRSYDRVRALPEHSCRGTRKQAKQSGRPAHDPACGFALRATAQHPLL
jgi:hypothetical protein